MKGSFISKWKERNRKKRNGMKETNLTRKKRNRKKETERKKHLVFAIFIIVMMLKCLKKKSYFNKTTCGLQANGMKILNILSLS